MRIDGVDAELLDRDAVREMVPFLDFDNARFPIKGGLLQRRGGTVRHDAVAWGYARGADSRGVDIIQNCEVTGIRIENGKVKGVETSKGFIGCKKLGLAAAGNPSEVAAMAGMKLPIESHVLQAFVSEGLKPYIDHGRHLRRRAFLCLAVGQGRARLRRRSRRLQFLCAARQSADGRACDRSRRGDDPGIARIRVLRSWGGIMDMSMDGSPIIDKTHIDGLYLNCRLVLWRLQGDAGLRLVLRPYDRQERAAQAQRAPTGSTASGAAT